MQNKHNFAAINATLCDIRSSDALFEEISIVMREDFAQTTSIVSRDNRVAQVNASIRSSWIWS